MSQVRRRQFLVAAGALLALPLAEAQQRAMPARIGYLTATNPQSARDFLDPFTQGMRELGYVEGRDFLIELRCAEGNLERLPALAEEMVRLKLDVITAAFTPAIRALQKATTSIPIVIAGQADPVLQGFAKSFARPGGNITGVSRLLPSMSTKILEILISAVPRLSRIAVFTEPSLSDVATAAAMRRKDLQDAARTKNVTVAFVEIRTWQDVENAFSTVVRDKLEAAIMELGPVMFPRRVRVAELATKNRLPTISNITDYAPRGGLISYGVNEADHWRQTAAYVDKILKGALPGNLPIEQASKFELIVNLKTANALGLTIPQSVLLQANEVIQ